VKSDDALSNVAYNFQLARCNMVATSFTGTNAVVLRKLLANDDDDDADDDDDVDGGDDDDADDDDDKSEPKNGRKLLEEEEEEEEEVGRSRLTVSKPGLKAPMDSELETRM